MGRRVRTSRLFDGNGGRSDSGSLELPDWIGRPTFSRLPHSSHPATSTQKMEGMRFFSTARSTTSASESSCCSLTSPAPPSPATCTYTMSTSRKRGEHRQRAGEREGNGECVNDDIGDHWTVGDDRSAIIQVWPVRAVLLCCCTDLAHCGERRMRWTLRTSSPRQREAEERSTKPESTWPTCMESLREDGAEMEDVRYGR